MKLLKPITNVSNVAPDKDFTVQLLVGPTYDNVTLNLSGTSFDATYITNLEFAINERPIQRWKTGSDVQAVNRYHKRGDDTANNCIKFHFHRPELKEMEERNAFSLGTADPTQIGPNSVLVRTMTIKGTISAAASADCAITCEAELDSQPKPLEAGVLTKILYSDFNAAAGTNTLPQLPKGVNAALIAIHYKKADVTLVEHTINTGGMATDLVRRISKTNLSDRDTTFGFVPQAGFTHVNFCRHGEVHADAVAVGPLQSLDQNLTITAGGTLTSYHEFADTYAGV